MPGAPIRFGLGVGRLCDRAMHPVAVVGGGRAIGGGSDKRMGELHPCPHFDEARVYRRVDRSNVDAERLGGSVQEQRVARWLGGSDQDEELGIGGQQ